MDRSTTSSQPAVADQLTARGSALLLARRGVAGAVDLIDLPSGAVTDSVAVPYAAFVVRGAGRGVFHALSADPAGGVLVTLRLRRGRLEMQSRVTTGGIEPCHVAVLPTGHLVVSNYTSGDVGVFDVEGDGTPRFAQRIGLSGSGPDSERQDGAHPHCTVVEAQPDRVSIVDLGADLLRELRRDEAGVWIATDAVRLASGSGPRHAVATDGALVLTDELAGSVTVLSAAGAQTIPSTALAGEAPVHPGDLTPIPGGVAVANRGRDSVGIVRVSPTGEPSLHAEHPVGVWPQQLGWDGDRVIVLEQGGRLIRVDPASGAVDIVLEGLDRPAWAIDLSVDDLHAEELA